MTAINIFKYLGIILGSIFVATGLAVLFFNVAPAYLPGAFKNMMGIVLVLYGIYRIVVTIYKNKWEENSNE